MRHCGTSLYPSLLFGGGLRVHLDNVYVHIMIMLMYCAAG